MKRILVIISLLAIMGFAFNAWALPRTQVEFSDTVHVLVAAGGQNHGEIGQSNGDSNGPGYGGNGDSNQGTGENGGYGPGDGDGNDGDGPADGSGYGATKGDCDNA